MAVENATAVQQTSEAGNGLARLAGDLQGMVEQFRLTKHRTTVLESS